MGAVGLESVYMFYKESISKKKLTGVRRVGLAVEGVARLSEFFLLRIHKCISYGLDKLNL